MLPWRLVAGAFLHFAVPAYLVAALVDAVLVAPPVRDLDSALHRLLPFSGSFLLVYAVLTVMASLAAALLDPPLRARRARREAADPQALARQSECRAIDALHRAQAEFGAAAMPVLESLRSRRWNHASSEIQALSRDLAALVDTSCAALASATPDRRADISRMAAEGLAGIDRGFAQVELSASRLDEGDARTVLRYVESRYASDSASKAL